jgi:subtilisin family serine protease/N-acetylneuraminic acid mutarotase
MTHRNDGVSRRLALFLAILGLAATALTVVAGVGAAQAAAGAAASDKVKPALAQQLADKGEASFWVRFQQADLSAAAKISNWDKRGEAVYDTLTAAARQTQGDTLALLDDAGVGYQAFWATNAIRVDVGDTALVEKIASDSAVKSLYPTFEYALEKPKKGKDIREVHSVEWGIANINADDVWNQFGVTGEGITVASIDSGVDYTHPALVGHYRGNNGDGTFNHNYNWFDAAGSCSGAPCDTNGHGTHTMGTMVGDDGAANQVGVAPGATWIEANGCCPSDAALIASGEWMLAPRDLQGQNPDTTKRPNIINNSWGSIVPSNDPFMEDVEQAWAAAGIWGQWSNGNSGPNCATSGSPGSRIINYSAGAYDINNNIAGFSARGTGQEGEIKPNIAAPGVNVRSSLPGGAYGALNGTSMASPHVAGAVALLWSAAPSLIGDIDATKALLDDTAVDTANSQCGGTADDNNVFGEGRLDALALVQAAPTGDTGTVEGTVTADGQPLDGATVEITGAGERTLTTDEDGAYSVRLEAGDYTLKVSQYGYVTQTRDVTVVADETLTEDFALATADLTTLSGTVTDGSGHDWPLYAKVAIEGPAPDVYTDPETGTYSVQVPDDATYALTVTAHYPGYEVTTEDVAVDGNTTHDVAVLVDDSTCTAPGYVFNTDGVTEAFESGTLPAGWTVVDNKGNGQVWRFDNPANRTNMTGGTGKFAIMDSDFYGSTGQQDTSLVTPSIDMTALTAPVVGFKQDYNNLGDFADVDVSIDGGTTWTTVLHQTTDVRGPREDVLQLPMAAGQANVKVRFHQYDADFDWWWEVDDVFVGNRTCDPVPGGLVVGTVRNAVTREGVVGATITSLDKPDEKATTEATPDDTGLIDGFYWMFSSITGSHRFEATAKQHGSQTRRATIDADDATRVNFNLAAGHLTVTPASLSGTRVLGGATLNRTVTITNDGTLPVNVELTEQDGGFVMQGADGSRTNTTKLAKEEGAPLQEIKAPTSITATGTAGHASNADPGTGPQDAPWTDIADYPQVVMDNRVVYVDGVAYSIAGGNGTASTAKVFAYDPAALAWSEKAPLPDARNAVAAGAVGGKIVVTGGWAAAGPSPSTWVYDPAGDAWAAAADSPVSLSASGQAVAGGKLYVVGGCTTSACTPMSSDVAAYDPATDSWTQLADYPDTVAFASCGGIGDKVYCTGGNDGGGGTAASFVYDPGADSWSPIADAPVDTWASGYTVANGTLVVNGGVQGAVITNRSFAYDPASEAWSDLPNTNTARYRGGMACGIYKIGGSSGGFTATVDSETLPGFEDCGSSAADVGWLTLTPTTATLAPGQSLQVRVTMDPAVAQPGTYSAGIGINDDAPGSVDPVDVTMTVTPPGSWGKLVGTVVGQACNGSTSPLGKATVQVDSWAGSWTFDTDGNGEYAYWFNAGANPLTLIAAKDGYQPKVRTVKLIRGSTVTADFTLMKRGC